MSRLELYSLRKTSETTWRVTKTDRDYNPTGHYDISDIRERLECTCFASNKPTCRHRQMIDLYKSDPMFREAMDSGWKWDHDRERLIAPLNPQQ